jgi:hypothetical protein
MKNVVYWDVAPCRSCVKRPFGGTHHLHLQGRKFRERGTSVSRWLQTETTLKVEAIRSSETSIHTKSIRRHIPEYGILQIMNLILWDDTNLIHKEHLLPTKPFGKKQKTYVKENHLIIIIRLLPNNFCLTGSSKGNALEQHLWCTRFEAQPRHRLSWLRFFGLLLSPSTEIPGHYLAEAKTSSFQTPSNSSLFMYRPIIRHRFWKLRLITYKKQILTYLIFAKYHPSLKFVFLAPVIPRGRLIEVCVLRGSNSDCRFCPKFVVQLFRNSTAILHRPKTNTRNEEILQSYRKFTWLCSVIWVLNLLSLLRLTLPAAPKLNTQNSLCLSGRIFQLENCSTDFDEILY